MARPPKSLLRDTHPDLAKQLVDKSLLGSLGTGSAKLVEWECDHGHRWMARPYNRSNPKNPTGCPICCGKQVLEGFNDLATTDPDVASLLVDSSMATQVTRTSNRKLKWRCDHGHEWVAPVSRLTAQGSRCPYCSGRLAVPGESDLATACPDIASQLVDQSLGSKLKPMSNRKVRWRCPDCGYEYDMFVYNRVEGKACPLCGGRHIVAGVNDLWTVAPEYARTLVDPSAGYHVGKASDTVLSWRCVNDPSHVWTSSCSNRLRSSVDHGCPICDNKTIVAGVNDLATTHPFIAAELVHPEDGRRVSAGSTKKLEWQCDKGHTWFATPAHRTGKNPTGCPVCCMAGTSLAEQRVADAVRLLVGDGCVETNVTGVLPGRYEIDVLVRSKGVAIEFNGVRWHSEIGGKPSNYHLRKLEMCEEAGLKLFQIWEDDWVLRKEVVVRMLAAKLGATSRLAEAFPEISQECSRTVFARKCEFVLVDGSVAAAFLDENHIQGRVSATYHFGLLFEGRIVALMSVRSPKANARVKRSEGEWEIQRYATRGHVVGGFTKLMRHAEQAILAMGEHLVRWVSFSDRCVSDGGMYSACGFSCVKVGAPDYRYIGNLTKWRRMPKERFQRKTFRENPDLRWDDAWTETEAAHQNGLWRIWDAGKVKWVRDVPVSQYDVSVEAPAVLGRYGIIKDEANDASAKSEPVAGGSVAAFRLRRSYEDVSSGLRDHFGEDDVKVVDAAGTEVLYVVSRDLYVADLTGEAHGWHWLGEVKDEDIALTRLSQMRRDEALRKEMQVRKADFVVFWDENLSDMDLWLAMGAPAAHDWERSYSWLSARMLSPLPLPVKRGTSQTFTTIAKHYQHEVVFARELAMWGDDVFLDKRHDKRRLVGAFFANRYHYLGKLPDELTDAEILRGIRIAGYANAYSRYDATPMLAFLAEHADVRRVVDSCAGWGERMLACASVGVSYEGVDVNGALADGYGRMIGELGLSGVSFTVHDAASADFGRADAVITCPPYLDVEMYSENGAENMDAVGFSRWWHEVVERCVASGCRWFCITTNQACRELFASAVVAAGFSEVLATPIGKGHASHFNRKRGGVSTKREFEEFIVFERDGLGE